MARPTRFGTLLVLSVLVAACAARPDPDAGGEEIFELMCARCHGVELDGRVGPPLGPGSEAATASDEFLRLTVTRGRGRMPSFAGSLTPEQIERVIAYIRQRQR